MRFEIVILDEHKYEQPRRGFVQPIISEAEHNLPRAADTRGFPNNGKIFVWEGYDVCERQFAPYELFRIPIEPNSGFDSNRSDHSQFQADGRKSEELKRHEYPHLVEAEFNLDNRTINIPYKPTRYLFLHSLRSDSLYGPFDYELDSQEPLEDGSFNINLKACQPLRGYELPNFLVWRLSNYVFHVIENNKETVILDDLKDIEAHNGRENIDYIPQDQLLKWGNSHFIGPSLSKRELQAYQDKIRSANPKTRFDQQRLTRLIPLTDQLNIWANSAQT